jgi:hypothetical protein
MKNNVLVLYGKLINFLWSRLFSYCMGNWMEKLYINLKDVFIIRFGSFQKICNFG